MDNGNPSRDAGHPGTKEYIDAIRDELRAILASRYFCHSRRYPALLRYLVENTLAGRADLLKERTLSTEVFERPASHDMTSDSIVRYTVGEVRKRLALYYSGEGRNATVRISLPLGSYIPEFLVDGVPPDENGERLSLPGLNPPKDGNSHSEFEAQLQEGLGAYVAGNGLAGPGAETREVADPSTDHASAPRRRVWWLGTLVVTVMLAVVVAVAWRHRTVQSQSPVSEFWAPVLRNQRPVVVCTGAVVFAKNNFSGVVTAGKADDYAFVSMQNASALAEINGLLERSGATTKLVFSAYEPVTELREHSVTLLGAYNNEWTLRLLQPLRFHFSQEPVEAIVDQAHPKLRWSRNHSLPYSGADDYALLARFRDPTIDGWVVALAGLGRNGTEAAAQFAVSPHYMEQLRHRIGQDLGSQNIEVVMKVKVIDGKTGAPSILAVHTW
jgi:hypothetical protein